MNIKYHGEVSYYRNNVIPFLYGDPFAYKRLIEDEARIENRNTEDPEQAPRPERGDKYIVVCTVIGVIVGCTAGVLIGSHFFGLGGVFLGLVGGFIAGGSIGVMVGSYLKKRTNKTPLRRVENDEQGPFIR